MSDLWTICAVNLDPATGTTVLLDQNQRQSLNTGKSYLRGRGDGAVDTDYLAVMEQKARAQFTLTDLKAALDACPCYGRAITADVDNDGVELWCQKMTSMGHRASGSVHEKMTCKLGLLLPTAVRATHSESEPASCDMELHAIYDGSNAPFILAGSQALEGTAASSRFWTAGPVVLNGTTIPGIERQEYQAGSKITVKGGSGSVYPTRCHIDNQMPTMSWDTSAIATLLGACGYAGASISADLVFWLLGLDNDGTRDLTKSITLTAKAGMVTVDNINANGDDDAVCSVVAHPTYNDTNDIVAFASDATCAASLSTVEAFCAGKVMLNGAELTGINSIQIQFGLEPLREPPTSGGYWPTRGAFSVRASLIRIGTSDAQALRTYALGGTVQAATDSLIYLRKKAQGGTRVANDTAQHIKFSINAGDIGVDTQDGDTSSTMKTSLVITPRKAGATLPIVIDTASVIA